MSDLPAILGTSTTVEIGGRRWTFSPLTIADEAELEVELRQRLDAKLRVVDQVRSILDGLRSDERIAMLQWAVAEEMRLRRLGPMELAQEFRLPEVDKIILRYQLRKNHPDVSEAEVGMLTSDHSARRAIAMLAKILEDAIPKDLGSALAAMVAATGQPRRDDGASSSATSQSATGGP